MELLDEDMCTWGGWVEKCTVLVTVCFTRAPALLADVELDFFFEAVDPGICLQP